MDQQLLSSRAIMGMYFARLEALPGSAWINAVSNYFNSDQPSENYVWLGLTPAMREWIGGRQAKGLRENNYVILNRHYEATIEFRKIDVKLDKTPQIQARINEFADRSITHWASLLSTLILNGPATLCYDGQYYFDTDHVEGSSGTQSNSISVTIANLPVQVKGSTTAPSIEQMQQSILQAIAQIIGFKDDQGEPLNEGASSFVVVVPPTLWLTGSAAVSAQALTAIAQNIVTSLPPNLSIDVQMNARLTWTAQFAVFRTDSPIKGLIRQDLQGVEFKSKAEGSEYEFDNDAWQFGIDTRRGAGYGYWQRACLVTMI